MARFQANLSSIERFAKFVEKTNSCWLWRGCLVPKGYGYFRLDGRRMTANRASYILHVGEIPKNKFVCHKCDNPTCVNPDHLFLGTHEDNMRDMVAKKRHQFGSKKPGSKLSDKYVKEIISINSKRYFERGEIAKMYGVSPAIITGILNGTRWRHLTARG